MNFIGRIELTRELRFSEAQKINKFFNTVHDRRPYRKVALEITSDGRAIQWNKSEAECLELCLADATELLKKMNITATGVIRVTGSDKLSYEIIVLHKKVKVHKDGQIWDVVPSPILE